MKKLLYPLAFTLTAFLTLYSCSAEEEEIITLPILQTSKEGELILDPFMGSGTTGRVCDKLGRSFIGYDLKMF